MIPRSKFSTFSYPLFSVYASFSLFSSCETSSNSSFSLPFFHPPPTFLPVTPQAPISPRHQFHHHQHTCNHHANPNLLIPSSNCLSKMNRSGGEPSASSNAPTAPNCASRSSPSSSSSTGQPSRLPPDISVMSSPNVLASAGTPQQQQPMLLPSPPSSALQPPPLDILPSSYHAQSNLQCVATRGSSPDVQNHHPRVHQDHQNALSVASQLLFPSSQSSPYAVNCHGGSVSSIGDAPVATTDHQNHCVARGRSHQRRERTSLSSPTEGAPGAVHHHFFERTSVSLVRRAPSQRRQDETEEDVAIDEEGLFVWLGSVVAEELVHHWDFIS